MLCSILYNRGVYPEESFGKVKKYGLPLLLSQDEGVKTFIANLNTRLSEWLEAEKLQRIVLVIMSKATNEVLERWRLIKKLLKKGIFDVLAYTDMDVAVPFTWTESNQKLIVNPQMVKLHSFDTKIHKVDTLVSYNNDEWDEQ
ncbi:putative mitotic spindle checkpoint protein Mad2 [Helianthus annuus]|nr:putative mitotic spindle checkpoint protein Mad2 [Helianthus annuus]